MSVEFDRGSPGKIASRTLSRETLSRWTGRTTVKIPWASFRKTLRGTTPHQANSSGRKEGYAYNPPLGLLAADKWGQH